MNFSENDLWAKTWQKCKHGSEIKVYTLWPVPLERTVHKKSVNCHSGLKAGELKLE